jgi:DNA-binding IclR family transcriptional regulator
VTARAAAGLGDRSAAIIAYISKHAEGVRADDVATALDMATNDARTYLARLFEKGRIHKQHRGLYTPVISVASVASERVDTPERHTSHTNNTPVGAGHDAAEVLY